MRYNVCEVINVKEIVRNKEIYIYAKRESWLFRS
jgi:hypothetical protein